MIHFENSITISRVMNCYAVIMQSPRENPMMKQVAGVMREANKIQNEDPLLEELKGKSTSIATEVEYVIDEIIPPDRNLLLFKTWKEVLGFLNTIEEA